MKIAFPTQQNQGLESTVHGHFGTARFFIIVDGDTGIPRAVENGDPRHAHGNCRPTVALGGVKVDAVVAGNIGRGALGKLMEAGITTYRGIEGTVSDNLLLIKTGKLPVYAMDQTCKGHDGTGCGNH